MKTISYKKSFIDLCESNRNSALKWKISDFFLTKKIILPVLWWFRNISEKRVSNQPEVFMNEYYTNDRIKRIEAIENSKQAVIYLRMNDSYCASNSYEWIKHLILWIVVVREKNTWVWFVNWNLLGKKVFI